MEGEIINIMDKDKALKQIRDEIWDLNESPLYEYRTQNNYYPVLGEGNHDAKIMLVGEAPGRNEAKSGKPFCGAAGKILDQLFESIGLVRADAYVTNIVKDRPPENRDPTPEEIALYGPYLERQIKIIQPLVICGLGRFSSQYVMNMFGIGDQMGVISTSHGKQFEAWADYGVVTVIPLYHPAASIYNRQLKDTLLHDFAAIKSLI